MHVWHHACGLVDVRRETLECKYIPYAKKTTRGYKWNEEAVLLPRFTMFTMFLFLIYTELHFSNANCRSIYPSGHRCQTPSLHTPTVYTHSFCTNKEYIIQGVYKITVKGWFISEKWGIVKNYKETNMDIIIFGEDFHRIRLKTSEWTWTEHTLRP